MKAKKPKVKKPTIKALKAEIARLNEHISFQEARTESRLRDANLKAESRLSEIIKDDAEHLKARTELIKALSWAMKACSSVAWSEKATGWDFSKLRR